ncbi:MAG: bifunctional phosphoribosyl-AMP cyclohydrolase/phosphoribosyl-ATP diphosphatase HisIE [Lachnospiraceae bacterium]|nr:bifunctional phosphoribosyl-AMP cyclohydrolase/phosphoribosyl-ATP diphosphatase HisIE [Lachnospiraceae bacterium]
MDKKELLVPLFLKNGQAVSSIEDMEPVADGDAVALAAQYSNCGADGILLFDLSEGDAEHDVSLHVIKQMAETVDIPIYAGGNIRRVEDVKKLLYAGCRKIFLNYEKAGNRAMTQEVSERFGKEKILACVTTGELDGLSEYQEFLGGAVWFDAEIPVQEGQEAGILGELPMVNQGDGFLVLCVDSWIEGDVVRTLSERAVSAVSSRELMGTSDFMEQKHFLKDSGIAVNTYEPSLRWEEIKTGSDGLLPVVVQDYKTQEVLMVAYMNQEAYGMTIRTGRMTYWSRSRKELWVKGLTSGHFQYVRELCIDCDNDTLLAKVAQVGAACHTGNRSCFYRSILKKDYDETNPLKVFEDVFQVILDRKEHPKKGSYTNYLFDKGIDKILKKVGEEATEIVIAAKNPDPEEIKYEISDFLYHVMVLMAEKGVSWEDITRELARR